MLSSVVLSKGALANADAVLRACAALNKSVTATFMRHGPYTFTVSSVAGAFEVFTATLPANATHGMLRKQLTRAAGTDLSRYALRCTADGRTHTLTAAHDSEKALCELLGVGYGALDVLVCDTDAVPYTCYIKTLTGMTITLYTSSHDTVADLVKQIEDLEGIPTDQQRIIFAGQQLEHTRMLEECGITNDTTLHLVLRLRGGMFHTSSGRVDNRAAELNAFKKQLNVNITTPDGQTYRLRCDTLAPVAALVPLLQDAMREPSDTDDEDHDGKDEEEEEDAEEDDWKDDEEEEDDDVDECSDAALRAQLDANVAAAQRALEAAQAAREAVLGGSSRKKRRLLA